MTAEDVLRDLACFLGAGGYNAPEVDPAEFGEKIRWGIQEVCKVAEQAQRVRIAAWIEAQGHALDCQPVRAVSSVLAELCKGIRGMK